MSSAQKVSGSKRVQEFAGAIFEELLGQTGFGTKFSSLIFLASGDLKSNHLNIILY
jgi:hypothetical protein